MINERLNELIKLAQGERSQNEFALHCGVSSATLTLIQKDERNPSHKILKKIASRAYNNVSYEDLMIAAGFMSEKDDDYVLPEIHFTSPNGKVTYGDKIKFIRESKKMNLRDFGKLIDCDFTYISRLENGIDKRSGKPFHPTMDTIKQICDRSGYDFRLFLEETGYISPAASQPAPTEIQTIFDSLDTESQNKLLGYAKRLQHDMTAKVESNKKSEKLESSENLA